MKMPQDARLDSTMALLKEGYDFISNGCRRHGGPVFASRILLQRTYCLQGHEAVRLFYESPNLTRVSAAPRMLVQTLFGAGAIQGMDGPGHLRRKQLFLELLTGEPARQLLRDVERELLHAAQSWVGADEVDVLPEIQGVLFRAVTRWAGLPPAECTHKRQKQLVALVDGAGSIGAGHLHARMARKQAERWGAGLISRQRSSAPIIADGTPADRIANYRDPFGKRLPARVAAVELLNLLRPVVAISYFVLYALVELARRPQWQTRLQEDDHALLPFVQEVRRLYAFFPFVAARVARPFEWQGLQFKQGARVLLDLYGSNRSGDTWVAPDEFRPERFEPLQLDPYTLVSQGGGDHRSGHRCPGEWLTIDIMQACLRLLVRHTRYQAPLIEGMPPRDRFPMMFQERFVLSGFQLLK